MITPIARAGLFAFVLAALPAGSAAARTAYDGYWSLTIATQRGACDRSYNFGVQVNNGVVTFNGPADLRGRVSPGGGVHVSVRAGDKFASGSGRATRNEARGRWSGRSGKDRCSGTWSARRARRSD